MGEDARTAQALAERFEELASGAPQVVPDADLWRRGRRSHRRVVAGTAVAAVLAVVALGAGAGALLRGPADVGVAGGEAAPALPTVLHAVPERFAQYDDQDGRWVSDLVTDDLAVGPAVAAWVSWGRLPVVVDAFDGEHQLLDLPDFVGENLLTATWQTGALALSPDGRSLAFGYAEFGPDSAVEPIPSGVRVLDLVDGSLLTVPLPGQEGTRVRALAWSPGGEHLAWAGDRLGSWTEASSGQSRPVAGVLDPRTGDDGRAVDARTAQRVSGDGDARLAVGDSGRLVVRDLSFAPTPRTLGRLADGRPLRLAQSREPDDEQAEVQIVGPDGATATAARVDLSALSTLTVATALLDPARPSTERPAPDWPWSDERKGLVGSLAVIALVFGGIAARRRWERRA